jgi:glycosyltransferase involved in cell wall biosynthesis
LPKFSSPAIRFLPGDFETTRQDLMGRLVANRSFLEGLIKYGGLEMLHAYTPQQACLGTTLEQLARDLNASMPFRVIEGHQLDQLTEVGGLMLCDPNLVANARARSFVGARAYALTGLTHTTADFAAMGMIADLATAPVQPWDALICTSRAVAAMVKELLGVEEARLAERLGATRFARPLLPVIPLGIDAARFAPRQEWRETWRERLGIGAEEVATLYVGRLSRHGKAHPLPMLTALGRAAQVQAHPPLHLILAGWWLYPPEEAIWREQAGVFCPEVRLHILDGRDEAVQRQIWSAADVFTLLVDNIQETFGLALVEAMAAGLPVVATDWNGFRDTVRHGVDGLLVPTVMSPPGEGLEAALRHATTNIHYGAWLSLTARLTAVDIGVAAQAFQALIADPALRHRMGAAGQLRVREVFDWAAVIPQYQILWREQQAIRLAAPGRGAGSDFPGPDPRYMDATQAFAAWPSGTFQPSQRLKPDPAAAAVNLANLVRFTAPALPSELDEGGIAVFLTQLHNRGEATGQELLEMLEPAQRRAGARAVLWLRRVGLVTAA